MFLFLKKISPSLIFSSPINNFIKVVLPAPDRPTIETNSFGSTIKETSFKAVMGQEFTLE
jgi:hypothetical protein